MKISVDIKCKDDWSHYKNKCLKAITDGKNFSDAVKLCQSMNATLNSIHSAEENDFVLNLIKYITNTVSLRIGAIRESAGVYEWINKKPFNYTNWQINDPDGYDYVYMRISDSQWYDFDDRDYPFFCEYMLS